MPWITVRYERAKLYEEVWARPVRTVAKSYGISDVALRKICIKLGVPLPPLGYWAKLAAGKKLSTPALRADSGPTEIVSQRFVSDDPFEPDPEHLVARREFEERPENKIVVSDSLDSPHPLVVAAQRGLKRPKRPWLQYEPKTGRRVLAIAVSEASLPRAFRIMDALVKALEARDMPLHVGTEKGLTYVVIQGQHLTIQLEEGIRRTERKPTDKELQKQKQYGYLYMRDRYSYEPTGMLTLAILHKHSGELQKMVADGKRQKVEECLNQFIVKLEAEAVNRKRDDERSERQRRLWEEEVRQEREREEIKAKEIERYKALEEEVQLWRKAEEIRAYVAAVEAKTLKKEGTIQFDGELNQWMQWARLKADLLDPLIKLNA